jgi:glutamate-ammonia-ligase adenylyltransferase
MMAQKETDDLHDARGFSRYARDLLEARPELREELDHAARAQWDARSMRDFLRKQDAGDEPALRRTLRRLRQRVLLRVLARDLAGLADLAEVCAAMTTLAEVSVTAALECLEPALEAEHGPPASGDRPQKLMVVGMGKLGGAELNVSSDIDLVFIYPEEGETQGPRPLSHHEFFDRLGRRLIALLNDATDAGRVFRVDMRLRPWGDEGPLATSLEALEHYLVTQGREWERYAWIKSRTLSGDQADALSAIVRPFVFRKYLDYGAIAAMRGLHAQIRAEVARREFADHIKLGPGGIREIEFIAQAFQLIRGGRDVSLQLRPTLGVLALLADKDLLPRQAVAELSGAYVFLRRLEHRLQYLDDAQTFELPVQEDDRGRIARSLRFATWDAFRAALEEHRGRVTGHFEAVFATEPTARHSLAPLWRDGGRTELEAKLAAIGFKEPGDSAGRLEGARRSSRYATLPQASRERFDALVPRLLEHSASQANPDVTLARCLNLLDTIARRAAYLALLDEHPEALAQVAKLISASSWTAEYLNRHPVVLDELLDARLLLASPDWEEFGRVLRHQLAQSPGDIERQMDALREAHHAQVFRLLALDLTGALTVERLADHLSELADAVLQVTLECVWSQLPGRHRERPRFAVIGYGKLGGKELGYASDLDIIFLHDEDDGEAQANYQRLAQRLNHWLGTRTAAGVLFDTDLRLRPDGASGLMVSSVDAFRRYQRETAWVWEHQALTRARFCAGDAEVGAAFEEERREILQMQRDETILRDEVLSMRQKLLEGHPNRSELFDLKHDRGGMIDIEFIVQYLVLAHARRHRELTDNVGNIALLRVAAALGLIPGDAAETVGSAYREFRRLQHGLRLNGAKYARAPQESVSAWVGATSALWRDVFGVE